MCSIFSKSDALVKEESLPAAVSATELTLASPKVNKPNSVQHSPALCVLELPLLSSV